MYKFNIIELNEKKFDVETMWDYIRVGKVIMVRYLTLKVDEVRYSEFVGICTSSKRKGAIISIVNRVKRERVEAKFSLFSPTLDYVRIIKKYRKQYRLRNIHKII